MEPEAQPDYWRVVIVEDHLLQRRRTEELLQAQAGMTVVHSCETLPEFLTWLTINPKSLHPHLLVLDLMVERGPSADPATVKKLIDRGLKVLVISALGSPPLVRQIVKAGVGGIVGKRDPEEDIVAAAWAVLNREEWMTLELASVIAGDPQRPKLSIQEERALVLYASGLTLDEVATQIGVKPDTAKQYLQRVKVKYAQAGRPASTKSDLTKIAWADGYLDPRRGT